MGLPRLLHLQVVTLGLAGSTGLELALCRLGLQLQQPGQPQGPLATREASLPPLGSGDNDICASLPGLTVRVTGSKVCGNAQHRANQHSLRVKNGISYERYSPDHQGPGSGLRAVSSLTCPFN